MKLFGSSWMVYLATVTAIYGSINLIAQRWMSDRLMGAALSSSTAIWQTLLCVTCPILWGAMFRGYLDLGGVAFGLVVLGIYLARPAHELSMRDGVILGICLAGLFLYRRWYTIWAVAFVATAGLEWLIELIRCLRIKNFYRSRARTKRNEGHHPLTSCAAPFEAIPIPEIAQQSYLPSMRTMVVAGIVAAGIVISFAWPILRRVLFNNYSEAYTAYRLDGDGLHRLNAFFRTIGYGTVALFTVSVIIGLCVRKTRRLTLFGTMLTVIMHLLFHRIQDLGPHHKLLYMPTYLMIVGAAGRIVIERFTRAIFPIAGGLVFAFLLVFEPSLDAIRRRLVPVAPEHPIYPVVRHDLPAIERAIQRVNDEARSRHTRFAVIASSTTINQYLVQNFHRATGSLRPCDWRLQLFPEVDKTGWYPKELFEVDVYLVADPVQYHLPMQEQQIVGIATEMLLNRVGIGASCREVGEPIVIDHGVSLRLFVRERAMTADEKNQFRDRLKAAHPDWPKLHGE